jgi:RHS repeat-associated protein
MSGLVSRTVTRTYDTGGVIGRNTGVTTDSGYAVTYGHGTTGRFSTVSWNIGTHTDSVQYGYLPNSHLLQSATFASGASAAYTFEPNRDLKTEVKNEYSSAPISKYNYTHDSTGRRDSATMTGDVFEGLALPPAPDELLMIDTGTTTLIGYAANDLNQYSSVDTNDAVVSPLYDEDGGLTDDGTLTYTWNGGNRLVTATPKTPAVGDKKLEFLYDYMGRRVRKNTSAWDGSTWQPSDTALFVYDGWNMIEELDGAGAVKASYVYGLDISQSLQGAGGIGGILARVDHATDKVHVYFYDANGNVGQLVDSTDGSVAAAYEYAPFGGLISAMGTYSGVNPFRFSTKYADDVTGLYYYGYRYYSPVLGRWLSRDPIQEDGGVNLYGFVGNNSIGKLDPLGNEELAQQLLGFAKSAGITAYQSALHTADAVNQGVIFPILDLLALPDEVLKCMFDLTDDDLLAYAAQFPGGADDAVVGVIIGGSKIPRLAKKIAGYAPPATKWPSNRGFIGRTEKIFLMPGTKIDRYGHEGGAFVSPKGTPFAARGLPADYLTTKPYNTYEVVKPIEVTSGKAAPAFDQLGLGIQYELPVSVGTLLKKGIIK